MFTQCGAHDTEGKESEGTRVNKQKHMSPALVGGAPKKKKINFQKNSRLN